MEDDWNRRSEQCVTVHRGSFEHDPRCLRILARGHEAAKELEQDKSVLNSESHNLFLRVVHVVPGTPADIAGIQVDDLVVSLDGETSILETWSEAQTPTASGHWECIIRKLGVVAQTGLFVRFACSRKLAGFEAHPSESVACLWLKKSFNSRRNCLGWSQLDLVHHLCSLEAFEFLLPFTSCKSNLPMTSQIIPMVPCCNVVSCYPFVFCFARPGPWMVYHGVVLVELGEFDLGDHVLEYFDNHYRYFGEKSIGNLAVVYQIKSFVLCTGMLLEFHVERLLEIYSEETDALVRQTIKALLERFAPEAVVALETLEPVIHQLEGHTIPWFRGKLLRASPAFEKRLEGTHDALDVQQLALKMHPDELIMLIWMGGYRANVQPWLDLLQDMAAPGCRLVPDFIGACIVVTGAAKSPAEGWLDPQDVVMTSTVVPVAVVSVAESELFALERNLFEKISGDPDLGFLSSPTVMYLKPSGRICHIIDDDTCQSVSQLFSVIAKNIRPL